MTHLLKPNDNGLASLDEVRAWMEAQTRETIEEKVEPAAPTNNGKVITQDDHAFTLYNIPLNGELYDVRMTHNVFHAGLNTPGARAVPVKATLNEWLSSPDDRKNADGEHFNIPSLQEMGAIILALYKNRRNEDGEQQILVNFAVADLCRDIQNGLIMATDVIYNTISNSTNRPEHIIHINGSEVKTYIRNIRFPYSTDEPVMEGLFGEKDQTIIDAMKWASGRDRLKVFSESKMDAEYHRFTAIETNDEHLVIRADLIDEKYAARGVIFTKREDGT